MSRRMSDFSPAWWLPDPHLQTVWGRLARPTRAVPLVRESLTMPDGDELLLDHLDTPSNGGPRFLLLHGLEGSSYSVYIQGLLTVIARHGWRATAVNWRSCARDPQHPLRWLPNRRPRLYHSGETTDLDFVLRTLRARDPHTPLVVFGASLGGNVLLKWMGEHPESSLIDAASTLSAPYDLGAGSRYLERGLGRFYVGHFRRTLTEKAQSLVDRFEEARAKLDMPRIRAARTFKEFDDVATAPLHGFSDAEDYYARSSSIFYIGKVTVPTLCLSAHDDPFLPESVLPRARAAASPAIDFRTTPRGGHVGFVAGTLPWRCNYWAEELVVAWLARKTVSRAA
jgi:predicted alpha/beta-fold hydrolase